MTPYERMWQRKPDVSHLRVFGSVCYPLIQKQFRSAYEHKRTCDVGIHVGYCHGAYLVYIPSKKRVYARRDCCFDENWQAVASVNGKTESIYTGSHRHCTLAPRFLCGHKLGPTVSPTGRPSCALRGI